jgi:hypothetical protein
VNALTVGLIPATLDPDGPIINRLRLDSTTVIASFDPKQISFDTAAQFLRSVYGTAVTITAGVPQ